MLQQEYEGDHPSFSDHIGSVMEAVTDDVKSVVEVAIETPKSVFSFLERGGGYFIVGFISGIITTVILRYIP